MEQPRIPLRKWAIAIYLCATGLKGVSSMKLHRDLKITQKSAGFMAHRLREAFASEQGLFAGRYNIRNMGTLKQMHNIVTGMVGKRLMYRDLVEVYQ